MRVVAIDGPAGSGKSTVARQLAERLGLDYLDTGAMYRAVAFAALRRGVDPTEPDAVARVAIDAEIEVGRDTVVVDGVDATIEIRGPEVTRAVSSVAGNPDVRAEVRRRQRAWADAHGGGVIEGRDIGTIVFPDAELKAFLTASLDERARRRHQEIADLDYDTVVADMARRDMIDSEREVHPLRAADDAVLVDTTGRSVDDVVAELLRRLP